MSECPSCGRPISMARDWCLCGEYIGWDRDVSSGPTAFDATVNSQNALIVAPPVLLAFVGEAPAELVLDPGETETLRLMVRNQSELVRRFRVHIDGVPDDCWSATPPEFGLNPWGTAPPFERHVAVELASHRLPPGRRLVRIALCCGDADAADAALSVPVEVRPLHDVAAEVVAARRVGVRTGRFRVRLENRGTATATVDVTYRDADGELRFRPERDSTLLRPGASAELRVRIKARHRLWAGLPRELAFEADVRFAGRQNAVPLRAAMRQRALFPRVTAGRLAVLGLAGIASVVAAVGRAPVPRFPPAPGPGPSPTATATAVSTTSPSPSPTPTPTATPSPSPAPSATPSATATATPLPDPEPSAGGVLAGTVAWPDGTPVSGVPVSFLSGSGERTLTTVGTDDRGAYRVPGLSRGSPVRAVLVVTADRLRLAPGRSGCILPLRPGDAGPADSWATPGPQDPVDWTTAEHCLEGDALPASWTAAEDDPAQGAPTWEDVEQALAG